MLDGVLEVVLGDGSCGCDSWDREFTGDGGGDEGLAMLDEKQQLAVLWRCSSDAPWLLLGLR